MPYLLDINHAYSLSSAVAAGAGTAIDNRAGTNYGMYQYFATGGSAILDLMVAAEGNMYMTALSVTATNGVTASGSFALYHPWLRADVRTRFAGATASFFIAPGLR